jgi:hypothetical protein
VRYINQNGEPVEGKEPVEKKNLVDSIGVWFFTILIGSALLAVMAGVLFLLVGIIARAYNWMMGAWL